MFRARFFGVAVPGLLVEAAAEDFILLSSATACSTADSVCTSPFSAGEIT